MHINGLILAGGKSKRYGSIKALAKIDGETYISRIYQALERVSNQVCIILSQSPPSELLLASKELTDCILYDKNLPCQGPLRGITTAMIELEGDYILYASVDYPYLTAKTLRSFVETAVNQHEASLATMLLDRGYLASSIGLISKSLAGTLGNLCSTKKEKSRLSDIYRLEGALLIGWSRVTGNPRELSNVNRPNDVIENIERVEETIIIDHDYFIHALKYWNTDPQTTLKYLLKEAEYYKARGLTLLYNHALKDIDHVKRMLGQV